MSCDGESLSRASISGRRRRSWTPSSTHQLHDFIELGVHQRYVDAVNGLMVACRHLRICSRSVSGCMEPAPSRPSPPALLTLPRPAASRCTTPCRPERSVFDSEESVDSVYSRRFIRCDQRYADFGVSATLLPGSSADSPERAVRRIICCGCVAYMPKANAPIESYTTLAIPNNSTPVVQSARLKRVPRSPRKVGDGVFADEHGFDHQQVVVERDHCVEQGDEPADEILSPAAAKMKNFEKACEGRDGRRREEREGHQHGQFGLVVETVVVLDATFPSVCCSTAETMPKIDRLPPCDQM